MIADRSNVEKTCVAWGDELPDWVLAMARAADQTSQSKLARQLGISGAQVSQIIARKYAGNTDYAEAQVRGNLMKTTISCPALGEIGTDLCQDWQNKSEAFSGHNSQRVRMMRACRKCDRCTHWRKDG